MSKTTSALIALGVVAGLGAAALPLSTYATDPVISDDNKTVSKDVTVKLEIEDLLQISTNDVDEVTLTTSTSAAPFVYKHDNPIVVNVVSRNSKGYDLTIAGSTADKTTKTGLFNEAGDEIKAGAFDTANLGTPTESIWGYAVATGDNNLGTAYTALAADGATTKIDGSTKATPADGQNTKLGFAAVVVDGQAAGNYEGKVTLTATNVTTAAEDNN